MRKTGGAVAAAGLRRSSSLACVVVVFKSEGKIKAISLFDPALFLDAIARFRGLDPSFVAEVGPCSTPSSRCRVEAGPRGLARGAFESGLEGEERAKERSRSKFPPAAAVSFSAPVFLSQNG